MDIRYNLHQPVVPQIVLNLTQLSWNARLYSNSHVQDSSFSTIVVNTTNDTTSERAILSASDETVASYQLRGTMTTNTKWLSPVVDISHPGTTLISNIVNNDATGETNPNGGNALFRYVTKQTTLDDDQDAEDLHVWLTVYLPASTTAKVYAKLSNVEDSDDFDTLSWIEMEAQSTPVSNKSNKNDFKEMEFRLPDSVLTGPNEEVQYTNSNGVTFTGYRSFAIKIIGLAADNSVIPIYKNARALCLQK